MELNNETVKKINSRKEQLTVSLKSQKGNEVDINLSSFTLIKWTEDIINETTKALIDVEGLSYMKMDMCDPI